MPARTGGVANIAEEYATKRYRANVVNWGMLPFVLDNASMYKIKPGDYIYIEGIKSFLEGDGETIDALLISGEKKTEIRLSLPAITRRSGNNSKRQPYQLLREAE